MVPSRFHRIEEIPLTENGKVDRKSLPDPGRTRPEVGTGYVAPRTRVERDLSAIWGEVLEVDQVGVDDNLFALGGDSLLSVQIAARSGDVLGEAVDVVKLFQHPTIRSLVTSLNGGVARGGAEMSARARARARRTALAARGSRGRPQP